MSASKAEESRFWLTFLLEDLAVEATFHPGLLHITLIPWFVSEVDDQTLIKDFSSWFKSHNHFKLKLGMEAKFGPKRNVGVTLLEPSLELDEMHQSALDFFAAVDGRWAVKNPHVDDEYIPHIRRRRGAKLPELGEIEVKSLSLVQAQRQEDNLRQVAAKVRLK